MVNFELGKEIWKVNLSTWHKREAEKIWLAQWTEHPPSVREVIGSIPVGDSYFFFVPRSWHVDQFTFHKLYILCALHNAFRKNEILINRFASSAEILAYILARQKHLGSLQRNCAVFESVAIYKK